MRFSTVSREGKYSRTGHDKVGYVTMMELRALMIADCRGCLAKACTIAVRYSLVRRQGGGKREVAVLDYPTQQHRLLPLVAACYAFHFTGTMALEATRRLGEATPCPPPHPASLRPLLARLFMRPLLARLFIPPVCSRCG